MVYFQYLICHWLLWRHAAPKATILPLGRCVPEPHGNRFNWVKVKSAIRSGVCRCNLLSGLNIFLPDKKSACPAPLRFKFLQQVCLFQSRVHTRSYIFLSWQAPLMDTAPADTVEASCLAHRKESGCNVLCHLGLCSIVHESCSLKASHFISEPQFNHLSNRDTAQHQGY